MSQSYLRISLLWTCLITLTCELVASNPPTLPPVLLPNPSGCNLGLPIKDFSCDASHFFEINVTNAPGTSLGVDVYLKEVRLIIAHQWAADLDVTLISPNDVAINLTSDNGSGQDNYGNPLDCSQYTTFVSSSSQGTCSTPVISSGTAPFIGVYLSEQDFLPIHDGTNPIDKWILQICDDGKEHVGTLEYVELVFEPLVCLNPTGVTVVSVGPNTVLLDWTPSLSCDSTIIEIGPVGFTPGNSFNGGSFNSIVVIDTCPPILVQGQGLTSSTAYVVYIREKCPLGFSNNSCPVNFVTTCSPPSVSLKEDFNSQTNCTAVCGVACPLSGIWSNSLIDDFDWIVSDKDNITTSGTGPSDDNPGGGKYIYIESSQSLCRSGNEGVLISNCIQVKAGADSCDMSFDYLLYGTHVNALKLEYKETDSTQWFLLDIIQGNRGNKWVTHYIDLNHLDGQTVQFRFVALGGNGNRADIGLDNITFYGSQDLGPPSYVYYLDEDEDGFGGQEIYFSSCSFEANAPGFATNNLDCNDLNPNVNPNISETPCNGYDQNCNGDADEFDFDPPIGFDTTVCSGIITSFKAASTFGGDLIWYSDPNGTDSVFIGSEFFLPSFPINYSSDSITLTYYVREKVNSTCFSSQLTAVSISILPQPDINTTDSPVICEDQSFDLRTVDVIDNNGANGIITYHNDLPANPTNEIDPNVTPSFGDTYYIASTPVGGCTDVVGVMFNILPTPNAEIIGQDSVCKETTQSLFATDIGNTGVLPLTYQWNTGASLQNINISNHPNLDSSDQYSVTITGANGCSSTDHLNVTTISNIHQVLRIVSDVTECEGNNGSILLKPLDGTAPFTFNWGFGMNYFGDSLVLNNLPQSSFSFTIKDNSTQKCPFVIPSMTVNGPGAVVVSSQVTDVSCNGLNDGCINLNVNGTTPIITWQDGSHGETICNLPAGVYEVTITDGDCENILDFEVKQPNKMIVNPTIIPPSCYGENNGSIDLNVFGGSPPYQFNWQNGLNTQKINNILAGNYPVTITDSHGCKQEFPALFIVAPSPIFYDTTALLFPTCFGYNDGKISIKPDGGTPPYDVDWSNGAMGTTINSLASGSYIVSIEDANGCLFTEPIQLNQPLPLGLIIENKIDPSCKGLSDGEFHISAIGGTGSLQFEWNNTDIEKDITGLPEGSYHVSITDANSCLFISETMPLIGPELLTVEAIISNPPCIGKNEGSIALLNNPSLYTFNWDIDESGPTIADQAPGTYSVTVTENSSGCQVDTTFYLTTNQMVSVNIDKTPPACEGQSNGRITIIANGVAPFSYNWGDTYENTKDRNLLAEGNYFATVSDANGCFIMTGDIFLEDPLPISIDLLAIDTPVCHGDSTGIVEVLASGGTGNLKYQWSTGDTSSWLNGLGQGVYTLSVTDEKNCASNSIYEITWPQPLSIKENRFISGCHSLDSICIDVSGGVGGYSFAWSHGDSSSCLVDVPIGDYVVTITDEAGCTQELMSIKVTDGANPIYLQKLQSKDSICYGETTGELAIYVDGGAYPYQYIWDNGITGTSSDSVLVLGNLEDGYYQVTITDNEGCTSVSTYLPIIEGSPLSSSILVSDAKCKEGAEGQISISTSGGFLPYQYIWKDLSGDTLYNGGSNTITDLSAGKYFLQLIDSQNCTQDTSASVFEPLYHLRIDTFHSTLTTCFGDEDGSINITPFGGTGPYEYLWNNGAVTQNISDISVGAYAVMIIDANDCILYDTFNVEGPNRPLTLDSFAIVEPMCFGEASGSIDVDMGGGTVPYTYDWGISNQEDLLNVGANQYALHVIDGTMLCIYDTTFLISEPSLLAVDTISTPSTGGAADGTCSAIPSGGTPPYQYFWETGDTTQTITGLLPGWYNYVVTDTNYCETVGGVMVGTYTSLFENEKILGFVAYPNPTTGLVKLDINLAQPLDIDMLLFNTWGQLIYVEQKSLVSNAIWQLDLQALPSGVYQVLLKNAENFLLTERIVKF